MEKLWNAVYALNIEVYHLGVFDTETGEMVTRVYRELDAGRPGE